jgi:uncharacterized Zn-finger protein
MRATIFWLCNCMTSAQSFNTRDRQLIFCNSPCEHVITPVADVVSFKKHFVKKADTNYTNWLATSPPPHNLQFQLQLQQENEKRAVSELNNPLQAH